MGHIRAHILFVGSTYDAIAFCTVRFSSASRLLNLISEEVQKVHRSEGSGLCEFEHGRSTDHASGLWEGWESNDDFKSSSDVGHDEDFSGDDLSCVLGAYGL